jgi:cell fate regulator YaaT (PSP1 superfamily)
MAGSITPLPVMLEEEDRKIYDQLEAPKSMVIRYGYMKMVAELPYDGDAKPGCGSKLVVRTRRGIELAEMLTTTCPNSGCAQAVSRKDMLGYIENSGGKDYPFTTQGKVLRVATAEDMAEQSRLDERKSKMIQFTRALLRELDLPMKLVDVELLLGGERIIFHYTAEQWVDFRDLVRRLAQEYQTRIEMHQVNARDEARLVADYEKCGQHCCCKQFLKVLKPVSMKSAKVQKATLDPTKISGRCGRLMCCLRYEDKTYSDLKQRLPHKQTRMMTEDGPGTVIGTQILTQLAMIRLDNGRDAAYPIEHLTKLAREDDPMFQERPARPAREERPSPRRERANDHPPREAKADVPPQPAASSDKPDGDAPADGEQKKRRRRRRRRRRKSDGGDGGGGQGGGD